MLIHLAGREPAAFRPPDQFLHATAGYALLQMSGYMSGQYLLQAFSEPIPALTYFGNMLFT